MTCCGGRNPFARKSSEALEMGETGFEGDAYMIAEASALLWLRVLYLPRRSAGLLLTFFRRQSIALAAPRLRNAVLSLTLAVGALCGAVAIWAFRDQQEVNLDTSTVVTVRNETVVYQQVPPPEPIVQESVENSPIEQFEASDEH